MAKKVCAICNKEMGALSMKTPIKDGVICLDCFGAVNKAVKIKPGKHKEYDAASLMDYIKAESPDYLAVDADRAAFVATKSIEKYLFIDENNKRFMVGKDGVICDYADLIAFELLEDGESITKGGLGGAVVGGLLAGGVGSVVGAVVSGKKSKSTCEAMDIKLTVISSVSDTLYIKFIGWAEKGCKTDSIHYRYARDNAQKCLSALQIIAHENEAANAPVVAAPAPAVDTAAELQRFHELMKSGVITEDDFNAKKAQLLGL